MIHAGAVCVAGGLLWLGAVGCGLVGAVESGVVVVFFFVVVDAERVGHS